MPAPYPLIKIPPGDIKDTFDFQAIHMAAAHNSILQGINAIVKHAPNVKGDKIKPFLVFATTVLSTFHHHHSAEETFTFPSYEAKLGKGAMSINLEQHEKFVPQAEQLEKYLKDVQEGKDKYDGKRIVDTIESFGDVMLEHLNAEVETLESSRMRAAFTEQELKDIDAGFMKIMLAATDYYTNLPLVMVCQDPDNLWFPPLPLPIKWATRYWFSRRHQEAWEFGPMDLYGNPRE